MADRLDNTGLGYLWGKLKKIFGTFTVNTGVIDSFPVIIQNSSIDESTVVENEWVFDDLDLGWMTTEGKLILYGDLPSGVTKPSVKLRLKKVFGETNGPKVCVMMDNDDGDITVVFNNLEPGTEYSYTLAFSDGTDSSYLANGNFTPTEPTYMLLFSFGIYKFESGSYQLNAVTFSSNTLSYIRPIETASGSIVSFWDGKNNAPMKVVAEINPVQDLHGYDYPWVGGAGKNKLPITGSTMTGNGITFTVVKDSDDNIVSVTATGTASAGATFNANTSCALKAGSYVINGCPSGGASSGKWRIRLGDSSDSYVGNDTGSGYSFTLNEDTTVTVKLVVELVGTAVNLTFYPMIRLSTETDATFTPYSNVCPISGFTGVDITRTGRNLANPVDARPSNIIQSTTGNMVENRSHTAYITFIPVKPFAKYTLSATNIHQRESGNTSSAYATVVEYSDADRATYLRRIVFSDSSDPSYTFTISGDAKYIRFSVGIGATDVQLEIGENVTEYTPYVGCDQFNVSFPSEAGTVYGGTLTINQDGTGTLLVDRVSVKFSDASWSRSVNSGVVSYKYVATGKKTGYGTVISSAYRTGTQTDSGEGTITGRISSVNVFIVDSRFNSIEDWLANVGNEALVYELANPVTFNFTAQQICSLLGENNLWADSGNVTVTYSVDKELHNVEAEPGGE